MNIAARERERENGFQGISYQAREGAHDDNGGSCLPASALHEWQHCLHWVDGSQEVRSHLLLHPLRWHILSVSDPHNACVAQENVYRAEGVRLLDGRTNCCTVPNIHNLRGKDDQKKKSGGKGKSGERRKTQVQLVLQVIMPLVSCRKTLPVLHATNMHKTSCAEEDVVIGAYCGVHSDEGRASCCLFENLGLS